MAQQGHPVGLTLPFDAHWKCAAKRCGAKYFQALSDDLSAATLVRGDSLTALVETTMDPLTWSFWWHFGMAVLCGAILGIERELNDKPAGLRTCIFVCLGSMLFVRLGAIVANDAADPTRVLGQIITGVGFIGAGVILSREGAVKGVTTAAVIWFVAAIGAMIGADVVAAALAVSIVGVVLLVCLEHVVLKKKEQAAAHGRDDKFEL